MACAPSKDSGQPGHQPSPISLRCPHEEALGPWSAQRRLWSDWVDAQADLSLHWEHMSFSWFYRVAVQFLLFEQRHSKTYKKTCSASTDSDQPVYLCSLITVFVDHTKKVWVLDIQKAARRRLIWVFTGHKLLCSFSCVTAHFYEPRHDKMCLRESLTRQDINWSAQLQRPARILKFGIYKLGSEQQRRWSDCADAQADLRLYCLHMA